MCPWRRLSTRRVYASHPFELHEDHLELPGKKSLRYVRLEGPPFVCVVPVTREERVVFVKVYRPPLRTSLLELPGGMIEPGETPPTAAARELEEETGYHGGTLRSLGWFFPTPHLSRGKGHLFLARGVRPGPPHPDEDEEIEVLTLPRDEAYRRLRQGLIRQSTAMLALFRAEPFLPPSMTVPGGRPARVPSSK